MKVLSSFCFGLSALSLAQSGHGAPRQGTGFNPNVNDWEISGAMLSVPRSRIAGAAAGSKAIFAGGYLDNDTYVDTVDIYDRTTGQWSTDKLPTVRSEIGSGSFGGRYALFAGGMDSNFAPLSIVDVYDTQTGKWSQFNLTVPRGAPRIVDLGDRAAIVGGLSGDLNYLSKTIDFVDLNFRVTSMEQPVFRPQFGLPMSDPNTGFGIVTSNYQNNDPGNRFNDFQGSPQTTLFNVVSNSVNVTRGADFPSPRFSVGGAGTNGIFAVGGGQVFGQDDSSDDSGPSARVDLFCQDRLEWCGTLQLAEPRTFPNSHQLGGRYVVFAGGDGSKVFDVLDTNTRQWVSHSPNIQLHTLRTGATSVSIDGCVILVGGGLVYQGANSTASVEIFNACTA
ncbi:hypothetical protein H4219_000237 [Mycoemilia scoparia]|uniref:Kelch repeat-containing protein n=1 Tax=Mycoemilia scoparia TaxID=417184 RepID=A0A9W8A761_9FUNG|nr:hypothetical protein H4219_000237 [Mycoemilia scoparia]